MAGWGNSRTAAWGTRHPLEISLQACAPGPGWSAARGPPAPWQPPPLPAAPAARPPQPPGLAPGTPRPALPWSPPAVVPVDGGGQRMSAGGRRWGGGRGAGGWAHLGIVELGLRAAQLLAQPDGSGLSLAQCCRHVLQFSLQGRGTSRGGFHPAASICASTSNPYHTGLGGRCKMGRPPGRTVWPFLKHLNVESPYGPAIPPLGVNQKNDNTCLCSSAFMHGQSSPNTHQWLAGWLAGWQVQAGGYHSGVKRSDAPTRATAWVNLGDITLSDRSQTQKDRHCLIPRI